MDPKFVTQTAGFEQEKKSECLGTKQLGKILPIKISTLWQRFNPRVNPKQQLQLFPSNAALQLHRKVDILGFPLEHSLFEPKPKGRANSPKSDTSLHNRHELVKGKFSQHSIAVLQKRFCGYGQVTGRHFFARVWRTESLLRLTEAYPFPPMLRLNRCEAILHLNPHLILGLMLPC